MSTGENSRGTNRASTTPTGETCAPGLFHMQPDTGAQDPSPLGAETPVGSMAYHTNSVFRVVAAHLWWAVFFLPFAVFLPAYLGEFGLRDDYSMIREAAEEPGKIFHFAASQGRPLYGLLLEGSFRFAKSVPALAVWRTVAIALVGATALLLAWTLIRHRRWVPAEAAAFAAIFSLLPYSQIVTGWAIAWPHVLAALAGLGAYALVERGLEADGWRRGAWAAAGYFVFVLGVFIYQPNVLTYLIPVAAGWLRPLRHWSRPQRARWFLQHLGFVAVSLTLAFVATTVWLHSGVIEPAARVVIEPAPWSKLLWFAERPVSQALALFVLHDQAGRTEPWYWVAVAGSIALLLFGVASSTEWRVGRALIRVAGLLALLLMAYSVNLVAAERWPTYRTLWPLTGVVLVAVWNGLRRLRPADDEYGTFTTLRRLAVSVGILALALQVHWNAVTLIAQPQQAEWRRFRAAAEALDPVSPGRVFVISPLPDEMRTPVRHLDEFGSFSADADWSAKEMMLQAMRAAHPWTVTPFRRVEWDSGYKLPRARETYDHVVDLRPPK